MKAAAWLLSFFLMSVSTARAGAAIYDSDPSHPWNRLSAALHSDSPLRFENPRDFDARSFAGPAYDGALKALDDFVIHQREKMIADPVKRAILQGELWATFDQVSDATGEKQPARLEIARRCAILIKRLALDDDVIARLPDPYALTVASKVFPVAFDPANHDAPFLPADLHVEGGPWVMLGSSMQDGQMPAAIQHARATQGRAVFYAMVRLPTGRQATLEYLKRLANFPQPYVPNEMYEKFPYARAAMSFNPALPQFPAGTQVALIRRAVLIDTRGEPVVSPIVESVQIRVYVRDPGTAQPGELGNQDFVELKLDPTELIAGRGGLRTSQPTSNATGLIFEKATLFSQGNNCNNCHGGVGVHSLNTYTRAFGPKPASPWFEPSTESWQNQFTLDWKKRDYTWGRLSTLLQSNQ